MFIVKWQAAYAEVLRCAGAGRILARERCGLRCGRLRITLLWIGRLLRICTISGRRCRRSLLRIALLWLLAVSLLRLFLIWRDVEALDRREHSAVVHSAVDAGIDIDTLARLKVVEKPHLVAGELYQYIIGMHNAVAVGP